MYPGCVVEETDAREHVWKSRVQNKGQLQRKPLTCVGHGRQMKDRRTEDARDSVYQRVVKESRVAKL